MIIKTKNSLAFISVLYFKPIDIILSFFMLRQSVTFHYQFVITFAWTHDSFFQIIFSFIKCLFLTLYFSPDKDRYTSFPKCNIFPNCASPHSSPYTNSKLKLPLWIIDWLILFAISTRKLISATNETAMTIFLSLSLILRFSDLH